jgi:membrane-associated phospholipid phosphatase
MDVNQGRYTIDRLLATYNVLLVIVWSTQLLRGPLAWVLLLAHLGGALLPAVLPAARRRASGPAAAVLELYPLVLLFVFWSEFDLLRFALHEGSRDASVAALDLAFFGQHLQASWMPAMPGIWISETMHFSYFAYYLLIVAPPLAMVLRGQPAAVRDIMLRLMLAYLACYAIYVFYPVDGPSYMTIRHSGAHEQGLFYQLVHQTLAVGDSRGTAFPSSHVAGAISIAFIGWIHFSRPVAWLITAEAVGVLLSTVYTQNHYAIDSLAGILLALPIQLMLLWNLRPRPDTWPLHLPPLPAAPALANNVASRARVGRDHALGLFQATENFR